MAIVSFSLSVAHRTAGGWECAILAATGERTHEDIAPHLCGEPVELGPGRARVALDTAPEMAADARGLVHGGFTFDLAD